MLYGVRIDISKDKRRLDTVGKHIYLYMIHIHTYSTIRGTPFSTYIYAIESSLDAWHQSTQKKKNSVQVEVKNKRFHFPEYEKKSNFLPFEILWVFSTFTSHTYLFSLVAKFCIIITFFSGFHCELFSFRPRVL